LACSYFEEFLWSAKQCSFQVKSLKGNIGLRLVRNLVTALCSQ
jgi:hypothetical protein